MFYHFWLSYMYKSIPHLQGYKNIHIFLLNFFDYISG